MAGMLTLCKAGQTGRLLSASGVRSSSVIMDASSRRAPPSDGVQPDLAAGARTLSTMREPTWLSLSLQTGFPFMNASPVVDNSFIFLGVQNISRVRELIAKSANDQRRMSASGHFLKAAAGAYHGRGYSRSGHSFLSVLFFMLCREPIMWTGDLIVREHDPLQMLWIRTA